jgi:hypothetical protein
MGAPIGPQQMKRKELALGKGGDREQDAHSLHPRSPREEWPDDLIGQ